MGNPLNSGPPVCCLAHLKPREKTNHPVVGANPGSKLDKTLAIPLESLDEERLLQHLEPAPT